MSSRFNKPARSAARNVDRESAKPRVYKKTAPVAEDQLSDSESNSELESDLEIGVKDDSRRFEISKPKKTEPFASTSSPAISKTSRQGKKLDDSKKEETSSLLAPHLTLLLGSVYHLSLNSITYSQPSLFIPYLRLPFSALHDAHSLVYDNSYLRKVCKDYFTPLSTLYYSLVFYMQILRAKTAADLITRIESQTLRRIERQFAFESFPIMSPMIGYLQQLGAVKPSDPNYSWICPSFPDFHHVTVNQGLKNVSTCPGVSRLPNLPALAGLISNFRNKVSYHDDSHFILPGNHNTNQEFVGLPFASNDDLKKADYQTVNLAPGWFAPSEQVNKVDLDSLAQKIKRLNFPEITNTTNLSTLSDWMLMPPDSDISWIGELIRIATCESKFFKGSTNLSMISPTTSTSSLIEFAYDRKGPRPSVLGTFYKDNDGSKNYFSNISIRAHNRDGSLTEQEVQLGLACQYLTLFEDTSYPANGNKTFPALVDSAFLSKTSGPWFNSTSSWEEPRPAPIVKSMETGLPDIVPNLRNLILSNLYDNTGKQSS